MEIWSNKSLTKIHQNKGPWGSLYSLQPTWIRTHSCLGNSHWRQALRRSPIVYWDIHPSRHQGMDSHRRQAGDCNQHWPLMQPLEERNTHCYPWWAQQGQATITNTGLFKKQRKHCQVQVLCCGHWRDSIANRLES